MDVVQGVLQAGVTSACVAGYVVVFRAFGRLVRALEYAWEERARRRAEAAQVVGEQIVRRE